MYAHIIHNLDPHFDDMQYMCHSGKSTVYALINLLYTTTKNLDKRYDVRQLMMDFEKAFDSVNHNIIVAKILDL